MTIQRWELKAPQGQEWEEMQHDDWGDYVEYDDIKHLLDQPRRCPHCEAREPIMAELVEALEHAVDTITAQAGEHEWTCHRALPMLREAIAKAQPPAQPPEDSN